MVGAPAAGGTLQIYNGSVAVGTLISSVDAFGDESATFTLLSDYRNLMTDANGDQFRWFQVIYYDDEPTPWNGNIITPAGAPAHSGTVVDTPAGGWDYEAPGGDDFSPFYESDTENNPSTGQPYAFPTLSYPDLHSPDGTNPGYSATEDSPGLSNPNHQTLFETFLAYEDPSLDASHTIDLLGGFSWGVATNASDVEYGLGPQNIPFSSIDPSMLAELDGALARSGFTGSYAWTVEATDPFAAPEPGTAALISAAFAGVLWLRRQRSSA